MNMLEFLSRSSAARRVGKAIGDLDKDTLPNPLAGRLGPAELHYNPLRNLPVAGGLINRTVNAPLHAIGLTGEVAESAAGGVGGELLLLAALASKYGGDDPNSAAGRAAQAALNEGPLHPGRAIASVRNGPDAPLAYAAGALQMAANPLNYTGAIGDTGRALELAGKFPRLAAALKGAALTGEIANRAPLAPLALIPRARAGLTELPAYLRPAEQAVAPQLAGVLERLGQMEPAPPLPTSPFPLPAPFPRSAERGNVPVAQLLKRIGLGPELPPAQDVPLPPLHGPALPERGNLPAEQLVPGIGRNGGRGIGPILHPEQGPQLPPALGPLSPERGNVPPDQRIPGIGRNGGRGIGPLHPIGPPAPSADDLARIGIPAEALTRTQERAARAVPDLIDTPGPLPALDFPDMGGDRRAALAGLSEPEITTLVNLAYPTEGAQASALLKYPHPVDLTEAALARITGDNRALGELSRVNDPLARKLAFLPEPEAPTLTPPAGRSAAAAITGATDAPLAAATATAEDAYPGFVALVNSVTGDLPLPTSDFYPKKLGVAAQDVPALFKRAADEGLIGALPHDPGRFAVRPPAAADDPLVLYHGSPRAFAAGEITPGRPGMYGSAISLTTDRARAAGYAGELGTQGVVHAYHPDIANPIEIGDLPPQFKGVGGKKFDELFAKLRDPQGQPYDAVVDEAAGNVFVYERGKLIPVVEQGTPNVDIPAQATDPADTIARGAAAKADLFGDAADGAAPAAQAVAPPTVATLRGKKGTISIPVRMPGSSGHAPQEVAATIYGDLAIHKSLEAGGKGYAVTHIPTGAVLVTDPTLAGAQRYIEPLLNSGADLTFTDIKTVPHETVALLGEAVKAVRDGTPKALGGDIAAGGGGMGLLPYPGGLNGPIGRAVVPAAAGGLTGAIAGAGIGAATDEDDRLGGALKGGLIGAGVGYAGAGGASMAGLDTAIAPAAREVAQAVGDRFTNTAADPEMWGSMLKAGWRGLKERGLVSTVHGPKDAWDAFWAQQRAQVVNTVKQLPQDALTERLTIEGIARDEFPGLTDRALRDTTGILRTEREAGVPLLDSQLPYVRDMKALGLDGLIADEKQAADLLGTDHGASLNDDPNRKQFGPLGRAIAGGLIGLGTAAKTVNPAAVVYGPVRGLAAPFVDEAIRFGNGIQHDKFRFLLGHLALQRDIPHLAEDFLSELARAGHNVKPLEGRRGFFSADEVAAAAGPQAGKDWRDLIEGLARGQGDRIAFLGGDFRDKLAKDYTGNVTAGDKVLGTVEKGIGKAAPFSRWGIRYAPVLAEIATRHPRAALLVGREMNRQQDEAKAQGKRAYQQGYTITDETPLVGLAARVRNGGAKGSLTVNPIASFMPYGDLLGGDELPEDATGYQKLIGAADKVGFSPNPVIQSLAYITGQDYRTPGALSRTAGLEAGVEALPAAARLAGVNVPDLPTLPSGRNLLDAGRELLSPVTGEHAVSSTEPEVRRYAELVLARTGKPLMDPANRAYVEAMRDPDNRLWSLAVAQARAAGAATNATGLVSPVQTTAQTREGAAAGAAQAAAPLPSDYQIAQAPKSQQPGLRAALDRVIALNPAVATYRNISPNARKQQQLAEWEQAHARQKQVTPALYAERRKAFVESLR